MENLYNIPSCISINSTSRACVLHLRRIGRQQRLTRYMGYTMSWSQLSSGLNVIEGGGGTLAKGTVVVVHT